MRLVTIFMLLLACVWLGLCVYLVLPQLIGLNFTGHIVLGGLAASLPATTALIGLSLMLIVMINKVNAMDMNLERLQATIAQSAKDKETQSDTESA